MILSVSRRTDIPAFYMDWFIGRLQAGYADIQNPRNRRQIRRVKLHCDETQFVFWSKNPLPVLRYLPDLDGFVYYLHFTLNPYDRMTEPNLPSREDRIDTFHALAEKIGGERLIWRYDPVILSDVMTPAWHCTQFLELARQLAGSFRRCIISFLDIYRCMRKRTADLGLRAPAVQEKREIAARFAEISHDLGFPLYACAEQDVQDLLPASVCVDAALLSELAGFPVTAGRDGSQRALCGCSASRDLGVYDACLHGCVYCYATHSYKAMEAKRRSYNMHSPLLLGSSAD